MSRVQSRRYDMWAYPAARVSTNPIDHILSVIAGISVSSIFETDARTSGYGLSSSSSSKGNSILQMKMSVGFGPTSHQLSVNGQHSA